MAEKSAEMMTREDKINQAKEYYGRGSRNLLVKDYAEAAEDFSRACELYADLYGENADELGLPHLYYAKALIALAQGGENKVLALQDEEEEEDDEAEAKAGGEAGGEAAAEDETEAEAEVEAEVEAEAEAKAEPEQESNDGSNDVGDAIAPAESKNGTTPVAKATESDKPSATNGNEVSSSTAEPQPGTSSGQINGSSSGAANGNADLADIPEEAEDEEDATNLQYAWEALEIAVKIFERMGESGLAHLADAYFELAEISLENDHCTEAVNDYERSCEIYLKLPDDNLRVIAETKYKIGLCYYMLCKFDESITAFKDSSDYLNGVVEAEKRKEEQNEKTEATIKEIEETRQEIANKIVEVQEAKDQSLEEVKRQIALFMNPIPESSSNGAGSSSAAAGSSVTADAKPSDISHLIKRKKPDTPTDTVDDESPAKKPAV